MFTFSLVTTDIVYKGVSTSKNRRAQFADRRRANILKDSVPSNCRVYEGGSHRKHLVRSTHESGDSQRVNSTCIEEQEQQPK